MSDDSSKSKLFQGINIEDCTLDTCPLELANLRYVPSLGGNVIFIVIFALALILHLALGIRYRTWGFMGGLAGGMVIEIVGYAGRVMMHYNPFTSNPFLIQIVCLTIAPAFITAAIYICLARIIVVYGEKHSRFRPATYTITFICFDFFALLLQAVGGGIANNAKTRSLRDTGVNIMIAGLSWQVASLVIFIILCLDFAFRYRKYGGGESNAAHDTVRRSRLFRSFIVALAAATVFILVRSSFRVAELSQGFTSDLANDQITFSILEGAMVSLSVILLTVFHPGLCFQGTWQDADFKQWGGRKSVNASGTPSEMEIEK
ncbi:MAG: hypothetical protein M1829_002089 [Trizodia sp. TS-e1964]|nr:MAG: hypothetical protein M1829_002089 [Trizodia sp. TS-e1964]